MFVIREAQLDGTKGKRTAAFWLLYMIVTPSDCHTEMFLTILLAAAVDSTRHEHHKGVRGCSVERYHLWLAERRNLL